MKKHLLAFGAISVLALTGCGKQKFILGLGGENVPVGQYASKILQYYEIDEKELAANGAISYGEDVKAVTTQVKQGVVGAGIIYRTDANSANLKVVGAATKEMCGQVIYPAAAIQNDAGKLDAAKSFLSYLTNAEAMAEFANVGFVSACEAVSEVAQVEDTIVLNVYAAASLTESLNAIKTKYETAHSNVTLAINFGSSGKLQTQIEEGKNLCDVFISAGKKQMDALAEGNLIVSDTRMNLLENQVVLAVPDNNPFNLNSFEDLKDQLLKVLEKK